MLEWFISDWVATLITPVVISAIISAGVGVLYKRAIQHTFDAKLEAARSEHARALEMLRSDLNAKSEQLAALRGGALSGLANRRAAIDKRGLEAIEKLWAAAVHLHQFKPATKMTQSLNMKRAIDGAAQKNAEGEAMQRFAEEIWKMTGLDKLRSIEQSVATERPFLPPLAWALYSAYSRVLCYAPAQLATIRTGVGSKMLADPAPMLDMVKSALPHMTAFIDEHGDSGLPFLIDDLEEALLKSLREALHNPGADEDSVAQAAKILKASEKYAIATERTPEIPKGLAT